MSVTDAVQARFLSVLSHDLRGAMHTVSLSLEMLRRDINSTADAAQMLEDLQLGQRALIDASTRLERLVAAERLRRGVMPVRPHKTDLVPIIRTISGNVSAAAMAAQTAVEPRITLNLPGQFILNTDPRLVGEMLGGLLDHAVHNASEAQITLTAQTQPPGIVISAPVVWISPAAEQLLHPASEISAFDPPTVSLFVAGRAADLLGVTFTLEPPDGPAQTLRATFHPR